jgi:hypothetical protein
MGKIALLLTSAPAAAGRGPIRPGTRFIDLNGTAPNLLSIQGRNGLGGVFIIGHLNEGKTASPAGFPIHRHVDARHGPELLEHGGQFGFRGLEAQIADKKIFHFSP